MMRPLVLAAALAASVASVSGCNTVEGFGQDISGAARTVQRAL